jgi:hypothetical protein
MQETLKKRYRFLLGANKTARESGKRGKKRNIIYD